MASNLEILRLESSFCSSLSLRSLARNLRKIFFGDSFRIVFLVFVGDDNPLVLIVREIMEMITMRCRKGTLSAVSKKPREIQNEEASIGSHTRLRSPRPAQQYLPLFLDGCFFNRGAATTTSSTSSSLDV